MIDLGWSKLLILGIIAIVVVGPKELPGLLRTIGRFMAQIRQHAAEFRAQFDEAMKGAEIDKLREEMNAIKRDAEETMRTVSDSVERDMEEARRSAEKAAADTRSAVEAAEPPPALSSSDQVNGAHAARPLSDDTLAPESASPATAASQQREAVAVGGQGRA
jgi:sec-independent protein translocase protein TatB